MPASGIEDAAVIVDLIQVMRRLKVETLRAKAAGRLPRA